VGTATWEPAGNPLVCQLVTKLKNHPLTNAESDADLAAIINAWPKLAADVRRTLASVARLSARKG